MDQEQPPRNRALELARPLVPKWRPTRKHVLSATRITVVVIVGVLGIFVLLYVIGRSIKSLFGIELISLLRVLAVPITVGAAVPLLNWLQKKRELDVEHQRAQDEALQVYLDQIGQLLVLVTASGANHLEDLYPLGPQEAGESGTEGARALHPGTP